MKFTFFATNGRTLILHIFFKKYRYRKSKSVHFKRSTGTELLLGASTEYRYRLTFKVPMPTFDQYIIIRGGVEDTRLEAKAKDTKKIRGQGQGQGQPFRGQNLSRPRTGTLEAKAKDQGHRRKCSPKKKSSKIFFRRSPIYWRTQNL